MEKTTTLHDWHSTCESHQPLLSSRPCSLPVCPVCLFWPVLPAYLVYLVCQACQAVPYTARIRTRLLGSAVGLADTCTGCNPLRSPWSPTVKVHPFQTAGHGRRELHPRGENGLSQSLGLQADGTTIHVMGYDLGTMVQRVTIAVLGGSRLIIPLTCAPNVRGERRVRRHARRQPVAWGRPSHGGQTRSMR